VGHMRPLQLFRQLNVQQGKPWHDLPVPRALHPEAVHQPDVCGGLHLQEALTAEQKRAAAASYAGRRMGPRGGGGGRGDHQWRRLRRVRPLGPAVLLPRWNTCA
jgi:hypothetical protein